MSSSERWERAKSFGASPTEGGLFFRPVQQVQVANPTASDEKKEHVTEPTREKESASAIATHPAVAIATHPAAHPVADERDGLGGERDELEGVGERELKMMVAEQQQVVLCMADAIVEKETEMLMRDEQLRDAHATVMKLRGELREEALLGAKKHHDASTGKMGGSGGGISKMGWLRISSLPGFKKDVNG
mmetsp:Transcript_155/g.433  ORF Transcript_155/g.433 Transcript_155/m.433 type:complete len:190 (+) Transcript_155:1-570(+)